MDHTAELLWAVLLLKVRWRSTAENVGRSDGLVLQQAHISSA